jgi:hypothetical protein
MMLLYSAIIILLSLTQVASAACNKALMTTGGSVTQPAYYRCTVDTDKNTLLGVQKGDIAYAEDTSALYVATATTPTWVAVSNSAPLGVASATSLSLTGTAGAGFLEEVAQTSVPTAPATGWRLYAESNGRFAWRRGSDSFTRTLDGPMTASRVFTLPDATTTLAGLAVPQTFTAVQTVQANVNVEQYSNDATGAGTRGRKFRGTSAAPLRVKTDDVLVSMLGSGGYAVDDTTAAVVGSDVGRFRWRAAQDFTSTEQGTYWELQTTPIGSTTAATAVKVFSTTGTNIGIPTGGDKGSGTLNTAAGHYVNGQAVATLVTGNEQALGDVSSTTRVRTSLATPTSLSNGDWWVDCTGVSPTRVCAIKVQDGGAARTIASVTY